jgi:predicted enzyme involved in methoxymalonyl-ACP biosynthesis
VLNIYSDLGWLPRTSAEFGAELKALANASDSLGTDLQRLATQALDLNQLTKLAKAKARFRLEGKSLRPLVPFRLAVLSNATIDLIVPALAASGLRHGIDLEIVQPSYDQVAQEALNPDSRVNSAKPDAVLFALDYRALPLKLAIGDADTAAGIVQGALGYLQALCQGIKSNSNAVCILQTFAPPAEVLFGNLDRSTSGTLKNMLERINSGVAEFARAEGHVLLDTASLAETVGLANWHDPQLWNMAKFPFADGFIPLYADHVSRIIGQLARSGGKLILMNRTWAAQQP